MEKIDLLKQYPEDEVSILGSVFLQVDTFDLIKNSLSVQDFTSPMLQDIYAAMLKVDSLHMVIDYTTVMVELNENYIDVLLSLTTAVPSVANLQNYIDIMKEKSNKRRLLEKFDELKKKDLSSEEMMLELSNEIESINVVSHHNIKKLGDGFDDYIKQLELRSKGKDNRLLTLFSELDKLVAIRPKQMGVIASRPKRGKSALALNLIRNFAKQGKRGMLFSLEMSEDEVTNRLIANMSAEYRGDKVPIPARDLSTLENFTNKQWNTILSAKKQIASMNVLISDDGSSEIENIVNSITAEHKRNKIDYVLIDYLQLLNTKEKVRGRVNEMAIITRKIKLTAMKLNIPIIVLSQFNRASDKENRKPKPSDLRDSGTIEQDANWLIVIHTKLTEDEIIEQDNEFGFYDVTLYVDLNRSGSNGKVHCDYYGDYLRFKEKIWNGERYTPVNERVLEDL